MYCKVLGMGWPMGHGLNGFIHNMSFNHKFMNENCQLFEFEVMLRNWSNDSNHISN